MLPIVLPAHSAFVRHCTQTDRDVSQIGEMREHMPLDEHGHRH
jgi:hypothetical protein